MKLNKRELRLYAVTDRAWLDGRRLKDDIIKAIEGGATIIQLREKDISKDEFISEALEVKDICNKYNVKLIINDNLDVMMAVDADGIHIGQNDLDAKYVRSKIGNDKILGVSCQTLDEAKKAVFDGADYLGVGTIFPTSTKDDAIKVSQDELLNICNNVNIPVVAIGGITLENIKELKNTMIDGVAVVSAIFAKKDIKKATKELLLEVEKLFFNPKNYDLFIVDYDGTVLDSMSLWKNICSSFVKSYNIIPHESLDYNVREFTIIEVAKYIRDLYFKDLKIEDVNEMINSYIMNRYINVPLKDNAIELLKELKKYGRVVLFSATSKELLIESINKHKINELFDDIYSASNLNLTKKDGTGYIKVLEEYGYKKPIIIEDAIHAIIGARNQGLDVLAIYDDMQDINKIKLNANYFINLKKGI